jgi:hypothetical protein
MADFDMDELIIYLQSLLEKKFSNEVANFYYGGIGVYLPSSFGGSRRDQKCVIALSPVNSKLIEGERVAISEQRHLAVDIITLVNITPFFEASPREAYGERMLVKLTSRIHEFLTHEDNVNLQGHVQFTKVGDIDWEWTGRGDQALRGAAIAYQARVRVPRL